MNSRKPTIKPLLDGEEDFDLLSATINRRFHKMSNNLTVEQKMNSTSFTYIYLLCIHKESNFNRQKWETYDLFTNLILIWTWYNATCIISNHFWNYRFVSQKTTWTNQQKTDSTWEEPAYILWWKVLLVLYFYQSLIHSGTSCSSRSWGGLVNEALQFSG